MSSTQQVARRYFDAWTSGDSDTVAALLSPAFSFAAGDLRIDGRDAFLDGGAFPRTRPPRSWPATSRRRTSAWSR